MLDTAALEHATEKLGFGDIISVPLQISDKLSSLSSNLCSSFAVTHDQHQDNGALMQLEDVCVVLDDDSASLGATMVDGEAATSSSTTALTSTSSADVTARVGPTPGTMAEASSVGVGVPVEHVFLKIIKVCAGRSKTLKVAPASGAKLNHLHVVVTVHSI